MRDLDLTLDRNYINPDNIKKFRLFIKTNLPAVIKPFIELATGYANGYKKIFDTAKLICEDIPLEILETPNISTIIQGGEYTAENIIKKFEVDKFFTGQYYLQKIEWLKDKIHECLPEQGEKKLEDLKWIKQFIFCITGKEGITATTQLIFRPKELEPDELEYYVAHTCFSTLDIPNGEITKEEFFKKLNITLSETEFTME